MGPALVLALILPERDLLVEAVVLLRFPEAPVAALDAVPVVVQLWEVTLLGAVQISLILRILPMDSVTTLLALRLAAEATQEATNKFRLTIISVETQ